MPEPRPFLGTWPICFRGVYMAPVLAPANALFGPLNPNVGAQASVLLLIPGNLETVSSARPRGSRCARRRRRVVGNWSCFT